MTPVLDSAHNRVMNSAAEQHDSRLLELLREQGKAEARVARIEKSIAWYAKDERNARMLTDEKRADLDAKLALHQQEAETAYRMVMAHEVGYTGWNRYFLVTSSSGHVHRSMNCSTCYNSTTFALLPTMSGHEVSDVVDAVGSALCSVCFPEAPVEWLDSEKIPPSVAMVLFEKGPEAFRVALDKLRAKRAAKAAKDDDLAARMAAMGRTKRPPRPRSVSFHSWEKRYPSESYYG